MSLNSEQVVSRLEQSVDADRALLVEMRRDLHAHPELSGQETATTRWIEQHLRDLGLTPTRLECGVGVICDVPVGSGGEPVVVVRADIDALAMQDEKDVGYLSLNDGVAHACGHDVHTTVVIGVARALVSLGDTAPISGTSRVRTTCGSPRSIWSRYSVDSSRVCRANSIAPSARSGCCIWCTAPFALVMPLTSSRAGHSCEGLFARATTRSGWMRRSSSRQR